MQLGREQNRRGRGVEAKVEVEDIDPIVRRDRKVDAGKSCATVESGKWVGPAKSAAAGEVVAVNDDLVANPAIANTDPYDKGWFVILKPSNWDDVKPGLTIGANVTAPYEAKMAADGFSGCT